MGRVCWIGCDIFVGLLAGRQTLASPKTAGFLFVAQAELCVVRFCHVPSPRRPVITSMSMSTPDAHRKRAEQERVLLDRVCFFASRVGVLYM